MCYFPDMTPHEKFQGATSTWVVWANSQFNTWKFLSLFGLFATASGDTIGRTPNDQYVIMRRSG